MRPKLHKLANSLSCQALLAAILTTTSCEKMPTLSKVEYKLADACQRDVDSESCERSLIRVVDVTSNPFTKTFKASNKKILLQAKSGELSGFSMTIPKGSFSGPFTITIHQTDKSTSLMNRLKNLVGLIDEVKILKILGSQKLSAPAILVLPAEMTKNLSQSEFDTVELQVTDGTKTLEIERSSIREANASLGKIEVAVTEWGYYEVISDKVVPAPGNSRLVASSDITYNSYKLSWTPATDNLTTQNNLMYEVRSSLVASMTTLELAESLGTVVIPYANNISSATVTGVPANKTSYYAVIVKDQLGNKALYSPGSVTTIKKPTPVVGGPGSVLGSTNSDSGGSQHSFYDEVNERHWIFYIDGTDLKFRYSADNVNWTSGIAMTFPAGRFSLHYKNVGGSSYVFIVNEENSFDVVLRRGALTANGVTFGSSVTVFDGSSATDRYTSPAVVTDDSNVWVASSRFTGTWQAVVRESINSPGASLASWQSAVNLGAVSGNPKAISLLPKGGQDLYAVYKDGDAVVGYTLTAGTWSSAHNGGDLSWMSLSGNKGLNYGVNALVWMSGSLYVGGQFTQAGGVSANYVAKWDGTSWSSLGSGVGGTVFALAAIGSDLYVGGGFTTAGSVAVNNIAKWDGTSWSAVGAGVNSGRVRALLPSGTDLFVGGDFFDAAGLANTMGFAKWDGTSWSSVGVGVDWYVNALAISGSDIYVGGEFSNAGGNAASRVAKWNGTVWSALGTGVNGTVSALAASGTDLYVGGQFTDAGGSGVPYLAKWNGTTWSGLGTGVNNFVTRLTLHSTELFVTGSFTFAGAISVSFKAKWDGSNWTQMSVSNMGPGPMLSYGGDLYLAESWVQKSTVHEWNGTSWTELGTGVNHQVSAIAMVGSDLYVGGYFNEIGGITTQGIAKWNGSSWSALGSGVEINQWVSSLAVLGSDLYVGGGFTTAGGVTVNNLAKWNGTTWSTVGDGVDGAVHALRFSGSDLYVGGSFSTAGGVVSASNIAKWDGTSWSALGLGVNSTVWDIAFIGMKVYAGGQFSTAGVVSANRIAMWDGTNWNALGSGVDQVVYSLATLATDLYVGGYFSNAGGSPAVGIAKWNGTAWSALGTGLGTGPWTAQVLSMTVVGSEIYAAGAFREAGGSSVKNVAKWNGTSWTGVGSIGTSGWVVDILFSGGQIFLGTMNDVNVLSPSIVSTTNPFDAAVNNSGDLILTYIDALGLVKVKNFTSGSWSAPIDVQSTGMCFAPQISSAPGTNELVALWYRDGALEYKKFSSSVWDASPTVLIPSSASSRFANCDPVVGDSIIKCVTTSRSSSPFDITTWSLAP